MKRSSTPQHLLLALLFALAAATASATYHSNNGNYRAVTDQTTLTSDGTVRINTKSHTHLRGAVISGTKATAITTGTLSTEDITNRADYNAMSVGVSLTHSTSPGRAKDNGAKPTIGLPQDIDKQSTTHTAINENSTTTITDQVQQPRIQTPGDKLDKKYFFL